jgi:hypothetical protein
VHTQMQYLCSCPWYCVQTGVEYHDGCHVWICFPELGWIEYHPFSVASCSADPCWRNRMLVHSKVYDRWTQVRVPIASQLALWQDSRRHFLELHFYATPKLNDCLALVQDLMAKVSEPGGRATRIIAKVQGPFEGEDMSASEELIYTHIVVFAGGIGATAVMPMVKRAAMRRSGELPGVFGQSICMQRVLHCMEAPSVSATDEFCNITGVAVWLPCSSDVTVTWM